MIRNLPALALSFISFVAAFSANAEVPKVAVDIAPLHSLVSQVMTGVGQPDLLIPAEASPHEYTLRPSQAKALSEADIVFWIGEGLTPWLEKALDNVAGSAQKIEVLELAGTTTYPYRKGATFEAHEHHDKAHNNDHDKEHHDDEATGETHHHSHEGTDPHAWLDPVNAKTWIKAIAKVLSEKDPANASVYARNASTASSRLDQLTIATQATIKSLGQPGFIVFHDAYQYFEKRFGISAAGAISLGDAQDPSPARVKEIQKIVKDLGATCVFTEPQFNPGLVDNVFTNTKVTTIGVMDPLGSSYAPGNQHYTQLINSMVKSLSACK